MIRNLILGVPLDFGNRGVEGGLVQYYAVNDSALEIKIRRGPETNEIFANIEDIESAVRTLTRDMLTYQRWRSLIHVGNRGVDEITFRMNASESGCVPVHKGANIVNVPLANLCEAGNTKALRKIWIRFNGVYWDMNVGGINHKTIFLAFND